MVNVRRRPFIFSLLLHGGVLVLLCMQFITLSKTYTEVTPTVNATVMSLPASALKPLAVETPKKKVSPPKPQPKVVPESLPKLEKAIEKTIIKKPIVKPTTQHHKVEKKKQVKQKTIDPELKKQQAATQQKKLAAVKAEKERQAAHATAIAGEVDRYKARILAAISDQWIIPSSATPDMSLKLLVQIAPNGDVLDVELLSGSGNPQLDRSAIAAVYKAVPLPVPRDPEVFLPFKRLVLTVRPENVLG